MIEVLFIGTSGNNNYIVSYQGIFYVVSESDCIITNKWHTYLISLGCLINVLETVE